MANKMTTKSRTNKKNFSPPTTSKPIVISFLAIFVLAGLYLVYRSFALSTIPVFNTDPDYWRDRIGLCESGGRYDRIGPNGHTGKYQYDALTWRSAVGPELAAQYPQAYMAPGEIQEMAFNNTFARRGTQPWSASYKCWIKGTTFAQAPAPTNPKQTITIPGPAGLPTTTPLPANPFGIPSESYNIIISGRVTLNDNPVAGVKIATCIEGKELITDADGRFSTPIPLDVSFCIRPINGIPEGARLSRTNNNIETAKQSTYEHQIAGVDAYHSIWYVLRPEFNWDRKYDTGYNFYYIK
jgi:hypothetical protein